MNTAAKIATGASVVVVAGLIALAAPAFVGIVTAVGPAADRIRELTTPVAEPVTESGSSSNTTTVDVTQVTRDRTPPNPLQERARAVGCDQFAAVGGYGRRDGVTSYVKPSPRPDMGARESASGPVLFYDDGGVATYTVRPGDSGMAIGERFCVDYITVFVANDIKGGVIHPGQVLQINP